MIVEWAVLNPVLVGISFIIDQYATSDKAAALMPVLQSRELHVLILITISLNQFINARLNAIVSRLARLVMEVTERVPLAGALSVELDFVVVTMSIQCRTDERYDFVNKTLTSETWCFNCSNRPVHGNRDTFLGFGVCTFNNLWSQEVKRSDNIFLAILVKDSPCTACTLLAEMLTIVYITPLTLGHPLDLREAVKIWNFGHIGRLIDFRSL